MLHFKVELDLGVKPKLINKNCLPPTPTSSLPQATFNDAIIYSQTMLFYAFNSKAGKKNNLFSICVGLLDEFLTSCRLEQFQV